jgi:hypothetical protein
MAATLEIVISEPGGAPAPGPVPPPAPTPPPLPPAPLPAGFGSPAPVPAPPAPPRPAPAAGDDDLPYGEPIPRGRPVPPLVGGRTSAFDRPVPVVVMGPKPLPVQVVGGLPGERPRREAGPEREPADRLATGTGLRRVLEAAGAGAQLAGGVGVGVAHNSFGALLSAVDGAAYMLRRAGPAGMVAAAGLQAAGSAATAFTRTVDALAARGRELAPFSSSLSASTARADVMRMQGDISEARRLGAQMGKMIELQQAGNEMLREFSIQVKIALLELLVPMARGLLESSVSVTEFVHETFPKYGGDTLVALRKILGALDSPVGDELDKWLKVGEGFVPPPAAPLPDPGGGALAPPVALP